jgi:Flp pilus assembly protein TadD
MLSACASNPPQSNEAIADAELRDTDRDVLFATEFPVANKAEAISRADAAQKVGEIDKALFFYVKALKFDPKDADVLSRIGGLHQYQGNAQLAVRAYSMALELQPDDARLLEARGLILLKHDEEERAKEDLTRAVVLNSNAWQAYNGLGLLADRRGNHAEAIAHYDAALAINPDSGPVLNNRGYSKLLASDYEGAGKDLSRAAQELGHRQAWVNLGTLFTRWGYYDLAVEAYEKVLTKPDALNKVAEASMGKGDLKTAERLLKQAIELSPTYFVDAEENLAQVRERLGGS